MSHDKCEHTTPYLINNNVYTNFKSVHNHYKCVAYVKIKICDDFESLLISQDYTQIMDFMEHPLVLCWQHFEDNDFIFLASSCEPVWPNGKALG